MTDQIPVGRTADQDCYQQTVEARLEDLFVAMGGARNEPSCVLLSVRIKVEALIDAEVNRIITSRRNV